MKNLNIFNSNNKNEYFKSERYGCKHVAVIVKNPINEDFLVKKFLSTETVHEYTPESNDGMRGGYSDTYDTDVYGYMEFVGKFDDNYVYDFYYIYNGIIMDKDLEDPDYKRYLFLRYNIRECMLIDKENNKLELKASDFAIKVSAESTLNYYRYNRARTNFSYSIVKKKKVKEEIILAKDVHSYCMEQVKPDSIEELIPLQCNYRKTIYFDVVIDLGSIPSEELIREFLGSNVRIKEDIVEDIEKSLNINRYTLDEFINVIKKHDITDASNIPENILLNILEEYPDMLDFFENKTLPGNIINKVLKGKVSWLDIPKEQLNKEDLLPFLKEIQTKEDIRYYDYDDFIVDSINESDKDIREECLEILDKISCIKLIEKRGLYRRIGEEQRYVNILNNAKDIEINNLEYLNIKNCPTQMLVRVLNKEYSSFSSVQNGSVFYEIVCELSDRLNPKKAVSGISDNLIIGEVFCTIDRKLEIDNINWVVNSICSCKDMKYLNLFTEDNLKKNADKILELCIANIKNHFNKEEYLDKENMWLLLSKIYGTWYLFKYISDNNKLKIKNYILENIDKEHSILVDIGHWTKYVVESLPFTNDDYIQFYLKAIGTKAKIYLDEIVPESTLNYLEQHLVLPCPSYNWLTDKHLVDIYVGHKVSSREELKSKLKEDSRIYEKVLTAAEGEKDGNKIPINNISKWLFGVPGKRGYLYFNPRRNDIYLPSNTPSKVIDIILDILGISK